MFGLSGALLVDAASFVLIAVVLAVAQRPARARARGPHPVAASASSTGSSSRATTGSVRTLLIGQSLALICFTLVVPIEVIYAKESLGTTERRLRDPAVLPGARAS